MGSAALIGTSARALGAEAAGDPADEEVVELEEVQVTGTRIQVPGNYVSANPITSVTGEDLRRLGMVNVSDALTTLVPQNISQYQSGMTGNLTGLQSSFFIGQTIANLRGLDPPFGSRTLTMIDGRRVVSTSNQADVVDLNIIPSNLLQRMDVVTGGASAAYGSGAMAGVVNLVLNNRLQGVNLDMDYGVHEAGDGGSKHIALSGGTSLFGGRGHLLAGGEWQEQNAIRNCAAARGWCADARGLLVNSDNQFVAPGTAFTPLIGYENMPFRFQVQDLRYSQFTPNGSIISQNVANQTGLRFTPDGTGVEAYDFGYRGGALAGSQVVGGDGPPVTFGTTLTPASERRTAFSRFEFEFTERLTGYAEASYAKTDGLNVQYPTQLSTCVRFNTPGVAEQQSVSYPAGTFIPTAEVFQIPGLFAWGFLPGNLDMANTGPDGWTLAIPYTTPAIAPIAATRGADENAYLAGLSAQAIEALQAAATTRNPGASASGNAPAAGNGATQLIYGEDSCAGHAGVYKVWNPQLQQRTEQEGETLRGVLGIKGSFGNSWRWDAYYQYGRTESESHQYNAMTTYRYHFATDAVIDNRQFLADGVTPNPSYNQAVCRVTRDGLPLTTASGEPFSNREGLLQLAEGCQPLNVFGSGSASPQALAYAFRPLRSTGENRLDVLAFTTSGTLWEGWAGPLTGAAGIEWRRDEVSNAGSDGLPIERIDFPFPWADAFAGSTKVLEEYAELNMPIVSGVPGLNLWSINGAVRHAQYKNEGGAGTTGESGTQNITNWKVSTMFEPFDWARLRVTRSRDLRTAGYRELYYNSQGAPDASSATNYWRPFNPANTALREDNLTTNTIGDPNLRPEKSDTLTVGFVLSPGGWAAGMRLSADYYDITVKNGLTQTFSSPIQACWAASGNVDPDPANPGEPGQNGLFDPDNEFCRMIQFGAPHPAYPDNPYSNIVSYNNSFENGEPFQTRGLDLSWDYVFPLNRMFESVAGSLALTVRGNRALEASGLLGEGLASALGIERVTVDYVGQLGSGLGWVPGIQPTPKWSGNIIATYLRGPLTVSLSTRYVGAAKIDKVFYSDGPGQPYWQDEAGNFLVGSIDDNDVPSYFNFALNGSYNLAIPGTRQFQLFGSVNNLFDKDPPYSGGYLSGASPQFHDIYGRSYRAGVRVRF